MSDFKSLELTDKARITDYLRRDPPRTSELTFTNLFMWRNHYRTAWAEAHDCVIFVQHPESQAPFGLPPIGPGDKGRALDFLFEHLSGLSSRPSIRRADKVFTDHHGDPSRYRVEPEPDHSDYVYLTQNLIDLSGRKYHQKKNHLNQFIKNNDFETRPIGAPLVESVLDMQESWCELRSCAEDPSLLNEDRAVYEAIRHYDDLDFLGLAVLIESRVEAFAIGEGLNPDTAVIHVEKANPEIRGLYAAVNQRFCRDILAGFRYVNREQDLGVEGLRRAKQSYHPDHMEEKFAIHRLET